MLRSSVAPPRPITKKIDTMGLEWKDEEDLSHLCMAKYVLKTLNELSHIAESTSYDVCQCASVEAMRGSGERLTLQGTWCPLGRNHVQSLS